MNRRHMLTTTVALAALPAMLASVARAQDTVMVPEKKHAEDTKKVGSLSLATSRVAKEKATDPMVKAFAGWGSR
jgi:putative membrane protein